MMTLRSAKTLDIFPILIDGGDLRSNNTPFRLKNMWRKTKGFKDLVRRQQLSFIFIGLRSCIGKHPS